MPVDLSYDGKRTFPRALNLGGAFDQVRRLVQGRGKDTTSYLIFWTKCIQSVPSRTTLLMTAGTLGHI